MCVCLVHWLRFIKNCHYFAFKKKTRNLIILVKKVCPVEINGMCLYISTNILSLQPVVYKKKRVKQLE